MQTSHRFTVIKRMLSGNACKQIGSLLLAFLLSGSTSTPVIGQIDPSIIGETRGGNKKQVKISYDVKSLHQDGQNTLENGAEVIWSFKKSNDVAQSGINSGHRDQFVAGLNHLYANAANQRLGNVFYTQGVEIFRKTQAGLSPIDSGERSRMYGFTGLEVQNDPMLVATIDGIAFLEETLTGKPNLVVGKRVASLMPFQNQSVYTAATGSELDKAWEQNDGTPLIVAVNANTRMFTGVAVDELRKYYENNEVPFGGHVIVISERRTSKNGFGPTSKFEYKLLNSWGDDQDGTPRNGWVGSDQLVSAMNFIDEEGAKDESFVPSRGRGSEDKLPIPRKNMFSRLNHGLVLNRDNSMIKFNHSTIGQAKVVDTIESISRGTPESESRELKRNIAKTNEGFDNDEQKAMLADIDQILTNKSSDGGERLFQLSDQEIAGVLHEANRLFKQSKKIYAQGLDRQDRNRGIMGLLHDTANPEHINQGAHNTCNVTTMMKIEAMTRPAAQAKRFVDMYVNKNGDGTANMPL